MDVLSLCPFRAGSLLWQQRRGAWVLTVVCRATFDLVPGEAQLSQHQEYPNEDDNYWNDDPARSLYSPSDLAPFKPRSDVVLVGHAFAPRGEPVRSLVARLIVGEIDKSIEVHAERAWTQDGQLREGPRFTKMPLRYERASGGPDTSNPVGVRADARPDAYGSVPVANLQPPGMVLGDRHDFIEPIGFGPIASGWQARREKLGRHAATWSDARWHVEPLPADVDPTYFNCAPRDQQAEALRDNERIILENLHPQHARLVTCLPGVHPRAFLDRGSPAPQEIAMACDTLWIDTDRAVCTTTWRGRALLESPTQSGRVLVAMEGPRQRISWADVERMAGGALEGTAMLELTVDGQVELVEDAPPTSRFGADGLRAASPASPPRPPASSSAAPPPPAPSSPSRLGQPPRAAPPADMARDADKDPPRPPAATPPLRRKYDTIVGSGGGTGLALPFVSTATQDPPAGASGTETGESKVAPSVGDASPTWLASQRPSSHPLGRLPAPAPTRASFADASADPRPVGAPLGVGVPRPGMAPLGDPASPAMPAPVQPPFVDSPWSGGPVRPGDSGSVPSASLNGLAQGRVVPHPPGSSSGVLAADGAPGAASAGVVAASNAAAAAAAAWSGKGAAPSDGATGTTARQVSARPSPRDVVELLWFDPESVLGIREKPAWKALVEELEPKPPELGFDGFDEKPPPETPQPIKDRRVVFGVLTRGGVIDAEGVGEAIADAVGDDGTFTPPLVLLSGELHFPFDELETLKATVTAVTPLVAGDKKLKETVDTVNELLKTPWLQSSSGVAEGLTARIKEAFAQGNRMLPASHLDSHTERILMEQRHYQRRTVFGEAWIRSLLHAPGASAPIPAYLPEALAKKLPMFQTVKTRLIAEAHVQQDQYESHPTALRVVALGRLIATASRGRKPPAPDAR